MARPRSFDPDEVAEGLLNAFWSRGFARTSIPDLTSATGLLPGSLYAAFGSKEDMFRIAIDRYATALGSATSRGPPGVEGIRALLDTIVRLTASDPERRGCLILNAIPESGGLSDEIRRDLQRGLQAMRRFIRDRLREAAEGMRSPPDLETFADLVVAAAVALPGPGLTGQDRRLLQNIADGATAAVRHGFAAG